MAQFEIKMPKMGESVEEGLITKWLVKEGDHIVEDDILAEIDTDKVSSEIPSPVAGKIVKIFFEEGDSVPVGKTIAIVALEGEDTDEVVSDNRNAVASIPESKTDEKPKASVENPMDFAKSERFYSPVVKTIAQKENVSLEELEKIKGNGLNGRVQKIDILDYIAQRSQVPHAKQKIEAVAAQPEVKMPQPAANKVWKAKEDELVAMDRITKLTAEHMVMSKQTSAHVTTMIEVDVTEMVLWRDKVKGQFQQQENLKLTFMPMIIEAVSRSLKQFPRVNASVEGENIILRKSINLGIAVALPDDNLIVPVIKSADERNLVGLTKELTRLADNARINKLKPEEIQEGTFTITNFGTFRNIMGTPIINQPQVAILGVGTIQKKPSVVETPSGDMIGIRHKMYLSLTYDHRIINGALGGRFLKHVSDLLEKFDVNRTL